MAEAVGEVVVKERDVCRSGETSGDELLEASMAAMDTLTSHVKERDVGRSGETSGDELLEASMAAMDTLTSHIRLRQAISLAAINDVVSHRRGRNAAMNDVVSHQIESNLGVELGKVKRTMFADGEIYFQLEESVRNGPNVYVNADPKDFRHSPA
ncbi:ribose-phosphate pyrophosphokinase [Striga asiatica]|uniref:Ribose-phosphate pyrophosphokinase n=1 Tax=Striga asiatica TaxID=4170 RepID=A0A5A7P558_STRAF|nr:ribose-phosphate pyrophosphokinase [Striga asiatica]